MSLRKSFVVLLGITALASSGLAQNEVLFKKSFGHSITGVIGNSNFIETPVVPLPAQQLHLGYLDLAGLRSLGLVDSFSTTESLRSAVLSRFGIQVVPTQNVASFRAENPQAPTLLSLAYDDGYLGRGDGRAGWLFEVAVPGLGTYDFGLKGSGSTFYTIPQESIDKGYHVAEKDGMLDLPEALRTLVNSKLLEAIGIESEKVYGIIETGKKTGFNLNPPDINDTAILLRAFETGLRAAHLTQYNPEQMAAVIDWLLKREAVRLGTTSLPTLKTYLHNKIVRDAVRAARAQYFWVAHGAINVANITENGWADLNYVEALSHPDALYTPLNIYGRLNHQAVELFRVTDDFSKRILKAPAPGVAEAAKLNVADLYWKTFNEELGRLELISAGLEPSVAERIAKTSMGQSYLRSLWRINYQNAGTNTRLLKADVAERLKTMNPRYSAAKQLQERDAEISREQLTKAADFDSSQTEFVIEEMDGPAERNRLAFESYEVIKRQQDTTARLMGSTIASDQGLRERFQDLPEIEGAIKLYRMYQLSPAVAQVSRADVRGGIISQGEYYGFLKETQLILQEVADITGQSIHKVLEETAGRARSVLQVPGLPNPARIAEEINAYKANPKGDVSSALQDTLGALMAARYGIENTFEMEAALNRRLEKVTKTASNGCDGSLAK
jgi:hypothetical protein